MQEIFEDVFSVQGGVGKVTGLRRGSHETALAQNQEVEGVSKPGEKSGGLWVNQNCGPGGANKFIPGGGSQDKVGPSRNLPLLGRLGEGGKGMSETSLTRLLLPKLTKCCINYHNKHQHWQTSTSISTTTRISI